METKYSRSEVLPYPNGQSVNQVSFLPPSPKSRLIVILWDVFILNSISKKSYLCLTVSNLHCTSRFYHQVFFCKYENQATCFWGFFNQRPGRGKEKFTGNRFKIFWKWQNFPGLHGGQRYQPSSNCNSTEGSWRSTGAVDYWFAIGYVPNQESCEAGFPVCLFLRRNHKKVNNF